MTDSDAARTALIDLVCDMWDHECAIDEVIDTIVVARQDVPCETCGGTRRIHDQRAAALGRPLRNVVSGGGTWSAECNTCTDGVVPGPLLIDVMMGWEQVGWVDLDGSLWPLKVTPFDNSEPVYRRTPTGED